ncbi:MAG: galactose ABC transporter substrate-binding protein [Lachnospiraceae bacterium]|nr:galactose ABC transporter substrate-binding protein [Lachnospiraceae bacterium]
MKKLLSVLLASLMVISLVACAQQTAPATTEAAAESVETAVESEAPAGPRTVRVGVSIYTFDDAFMTLYRNELARYFESKNNDQVTYEVTMQDGKNDQAEQTNQIDNFIAQGYDVLILNLVQSTSAATVMDKCAAAGIPVVFINREPSESDMQSHNTGDYAGKFTYVGADARQSGRFQGELIADLENKGDLNGDGKLQYVMIEGDPENVDAQYRTEFSISQYKEKTGNEVECLDDQVGNWQRAEGQRLAANALTQYGDQIEVIFCNNDDMAMGAKVAIEAAGRKINENIYLVGVDALAEAVEAVIAGEMTGTVLNDHNGQSHAAVDCAIAAANGEALELYNWVDYVKVTPENASQYK